MGCSACRPGAAPSVIWSVPDGSYAMAITSRDPTCGNGVPLARRCGPGTERSSKRTERSLAEGRHASRSYPRPCRSSSDATLTSDEGDAVYTQRLENVRTRLREEQIDALLVGPSADLRYLTGYDALPLERLTLLVVPAEGPAHLVLPELELARAQDSGATDLAQPRAWGETEDPIDIVRSLVADAHALAVQDQLWTSFTLRLQAAIPAAR